MLSLLHLHALLPAPVQLKCHQHLFPVPFLNAQISSHPDHPPISTNYVKHMLLQHIICASCWIWTWDVLFLENGCQEVQKPSQLLLFVMLNGYWISFVHPSVQHYPLSWKVPSNDLTSGRLNLPVSGMFLLLADWQNSRDHPDHRAMGFDSTLLHHVLCLAICM